MTVHARATEELTDFELVERVRGGARADFEVLVRRHNQRMFRATRAVTGSDADAEDALQQAWLDVYRHLSQFRGDAAFSTWATRIAVNAAISNTRKRPAIAEVVDRVDSNAQPERDVERGQIGKLLEACLDELPAGSREVLVLRDVLELDTAETATCLGISEEAVRVRLHRARAAIAASLASHAGEVYSFDGARCDRITWKVMAIVLQA